MQHVSLDHQSLTINGTTRGEGLILNSVSIQRSLDESISAKHLKVNMIFYGLWENQRK